MPLDLGLLSFGVVDLMLRCSSFFQILAIDPLELAVDQLLLSVDPLYVDPLAVDLLSVDPLAIDSPFLSPPFCYHPLEEKSFHSGLTGVG